MAASAVSLDAGAVRPRHSDRGVAGVARPCACCGCTRPCRSIGRSARSRGRRATSSCLFAVPLYILMGEILLRSGVAMRMYGAMIKWLSWLPGGLMHSNIGACAMFAATSGSSVATAATIGTVALPQQRRHKLQRAPVSRLRRRRRHARHPHSALDQHGDLRSARRAIDPAALSRLVHSRAFFSPSCSR